MSSEAVTTNDLEAIFNEIFPSVTIIDFFYPVGSYYETSDTTFNPNVVWTGTWELETSGQIHVSSGTGYSINGALSNTTDGGAKTSTTNSYALKEADLPKITGTFTIRGYQNSSGTNGVTVVETSGKFTRVTNGTPSVVKSATTTGTSQDITYEFGGGGSHNHGSISTIQPYIIVNRWHRTA